MIDQTTTALPVSRRGVLLGTGAVAVLGAVGTGTVPAMAKGRRTPQVGLLTASFPGRPTVTRRGDRLAAGLAIGLGTEVGTLRRATVPFGLHGVTDAAVSLLDAGVEVIVAAISEPLAQPLAGLCAERGAALVVANAGAHVPDEVGVRGRPRALHTSTQHWQAALSAGGWARRQFGKRLHVVVAAPDAGFDTVFALQRGFAAAGGKVVAITMTHDDAGTRGLVAEVRASLPDVVGVCASGSRAAEIVQALRAAGVRAPVVLDPLAEESGTLAGLGPLTQQLYLARAACDATRLRALKRELKARGHRAPDAFDVLGNDTGLLIATGAARLGGRDWSALPEVLAGVRVKGARGVQRVHPRTGVVSTPLAVHRIRRKGGRPVSVPIASRPRVAGDLATVAVLRGRTASGYVNEYLLT